MRIHLTCDCGQKFDVGDDMPGRSVACPACGRSLTVPGTPAPAGASPGLTFDRPPAANPRRTIALILLASSLISAVVLWILWDKPIPMPVKIIWLAATVMDALLALVMSRLARAG